MEDFKENKVSNISIEKSMELELDNKRKKGVYNNPIINQEFYYNRSNVNEKSDYVVSRTKKNILLWGYALFSLTTNVLLYKRTIRFVKKYLKVKGFWPIHFAIFPIISFTNFTLLGVLDGFYSANEIRSLYFN